MSETICIINSKICPLNDNSFCQATKECIEEMGGCINQGKL